MAQYTIDNVYGSPIDFECNSDDLKRTLQNAKNLLMIRMGEVPYDRYMGFDHDLFDLPLNELNERLMTEIDRLMLYEPDVVAVSAKASILNNNQVLITVVIETEIE